MKKLTLMINKEEKTFVIPFVSGMVLRKYVELMNSIKDKRNLSLEEFDSCAELVVYAFNNQFTFEEYLNGVPAEKAAIMVDLLFLPDGEETDDDKKKSLLTKNSVN